MNWQKIKDECPKAWEAFRKWAEIPVEMFRERDLFDFFDDRGIDCYVGLYPHRTNEHYLILTYLIIIHGANDSEEFGDQCGESRKEVESAAFTRGFQILNQQLS